MEVYTYKSIYIGCFPSWIISTYITKYKDIYTRKGVNIINLGEGIRPLLPLQIHSLQLPLLRAIDSTQQPFFRAVYKHSQLTYSRCDLSFFKMTLFKQKFLPISFCQTNLLYFRVNLYSFKLEFFKRNFLLLTDHTYHKLEIIMRKFLSLGERDFLFSVKQHSKYYEMNLSSDSFSQVSSLPIKPLYKYFPQVLCQVTFQDVA